jgi:hypothetical protein
MSHDSPVESESTTARASDAQNHATPLQPLETIGELAAWSPCYICFDGAGLRSYSSIVVVRLLMHEIWMWENEMADEDNAKAESEADLHPGNTNFAQVPPESELLPCHYFDFFYGTSHGGLVATLLGRLRLRVDDAADEYIDITQAVFRDRRLLSSALPLEHIKFRGYKREDLRKAVHNTVAKHSIDRTECDGTDQLFRCPAMTIWPGKSDTPRQAQTCVAVAACTDGGLPKPHLLRTFEAGSGHDEDLETSDMLFTDRLNLTICDVLMAAMATDRFFSPLKTRSGTKTATMLDGSDHIPNPTYKARADYESFYPVSSKWSRRRNPALSSGSSSYIKHSTSEEPALFLSIGHRRSPKGKEKSNIMSARKVHTHQIRTNQSLIF